MNLYDYSLYILLATGTVLSPGPAVLYTIGNTLTHGRRQAVAGFCGVAAGILLVATLASILVLSLVSMLGPAARIMQYVGAIYLIYLGIKSWCRGGVNHLTVDKVSVSNKGLFFRGILISLLNPKAIAFFTSLFPQFIDLRDGNLLQCGLLAVTFSLIVLLVHSGYCLGIHWLGMRVVGARMALVINRLSGAMFLLFGLTLLSRS